MINDREAKRNFELRLKRTEEDRKQNNWFFFPFLCKWWLEVKSPIFVLLVKPESWTIFKSYTSDIDPILDNHPFPIISLLGRISIECLNKGIYDKEPIGTQLKKTTLPKARENVSGKSQFIVLNLIGRESGASFLVQQSKIQ